MVDFFMTNIDLLGMMFFIDVVITKTLLENQNDEKKYLKTNK